MSVYLLVIKTKSIYIKGLLYFSVVVVVFEKLWSMYTINGCACARRWQIWVLQFRRNMIFVTNNVVKSTLVLMFFCSFYYLCWPLGWSGLCFGIWENIPVEFLFVICSRVPKFVESTLHYSYLPTYILFNIYTDLKHLFFFPHSS